MTVWNVATVVGASGDLQDLSGAANEDVAITDGYSAAGDGGGGEFYLDASPPDSVTVAGTTAQSVSISGATNAAPIVITATAHGYATGQVVVISGVGGNTAANGTWTVTVIDVNHFSLNGSTGSGTYTSSTGMAQTTLITTSAAHGLASGRQMMVAGVGGTTSANGTWIVTVPSGSTTTFSIGIAWNAAWTSGGYVGDGGTSIPSKVVGLGLWLRLDATNSSTIEVHWFGGGSNARYFKTVNGKWYQDSGYTTVASDDAIKFFNAASCAQALAVATTTSDVGAQATVHARSGIWYFTAKHGNDIDVTGQYGNEFLLWPSGVDMRGDGDATVIFIDSFVNNASPFGGYSCVFGNNTVVGGAGGGLYNCTFSDFSVDHNLQSPGIFYNQWASYPYGGLAVGYCENSVVLCNEGDQVHCRNILSLWHNGVFAIHIGSYGAPQKMTNFSIVNCRVKNPGNDPNSGDASYIACGGTNGTIVGNNVYCHTTFYPPSAYELHGNNLVISDNQAHHFNAALNLGGDSADSWQTMISDNVFHNCTVGITIFNEGVFAIRGLTIQDNNLSCFWRGISMQLADTPHGLFDCKIADNLVTCADFSSAETGFGIEMQGNVGYINATTWSAHTGYALGASVVPSGSPTFYFTNVSGVGTSGAVEPDFVLAGAVQIGVIVNDNGISWMCEGSIYQGGLDIVDNDVSGFAGGIGIYPQFSTDRLIGVRIQGNTISNCGQSSTAQTVNAGIYIGYGVSGAASAQFNHLWVDGNSINDTLSTHGLLNGIYADAWLDSTCAISGNNVDGETGSDVVISTGTYSSSAPGVVQHWSQACVSTIFNANGTMTLPAGVTDFLYDMWGGGGGAAGSATGSNGGPGAGGWTGGGGGGAIRQAGWVRGQSPLSTVSVVVGAGGTAGTGVGATLTAGGPGGDSTITISSTVVAAASGASGGGTQATNYTSYAAGGASFKGYGGGNVYVAPSSNAEFAGSLASFVASAPVAAGGYGAASGSGGGGAGYRNLAGGFEAGAGGTAGTNTGGYIGGAGGAGGGAGPGGPGGTGGNGSNGNSSGNTSVGGNGGSGAANSGAGGGSGGGSGTASGTAGTAGAAGAGGSGRAIIVYFQG